MIITDPQPLSIIGHFWPLLDLDHRLFLTTGHFRPLEIFHRFVVTSHNIYFRHFYFTLYCQWVYYYCFCLFIYFISVREIGQQRQPARQNVSHRCFVPPSRFRFIQHLLLQSFTGKLCTNNAKGVDHQDEANLVRTSIRSAVWVGGRFYNNKWYWSFIDTHHYKPALCHIF